MAAGLAALDALEVPGFHAALDSKAERLAAGFRRALEESGVPGSVNVSGSLLTLFFAAGPVRDYAAAKTSDTARFASFFREMLARRFLLPPSQFEALFVSAAHTDSDIAATIAAARESLKAVR
jgi:glutamate-1-semialdehyde 2,1-aminomutase